MHPTLYCNSISHILTISHNLMQLLEAIARILIHIATSFLTTKFSQGKIRMYDSLCTLVVKETLEKYHIENSS